MNSFKLLLVSFTITFIALMTISPANAKHAVNVQHLNVNNTLTTKFNNNDMINIAGNYRSSFSTGLILSAPIVLSDRNSKLTIDVVNKSNDFFTSAMVFNDKLHQLISYFTTPNNETLIEPTTSTPESEVIEKKCENTFSFNFS
ncbi:hypothetical protein [Colwellia psychrerythraea]|uniref:Lipoprotein n=1 Tax=Colwellia psychrerythraea (strain 34H / ATCC BAA-681) TaxID=167879 RepID=Q486P7_COLP3|nr:hypothetical protein [Colwellia psychrerythraea]AAZ24971.1 hypothetical protein CPS_1225 [Colwellia psychrerythraea 34H]